MKPSVESSCTSEFNKLKRVILCEPTYMSIEGKINETQKKFKDDEFHLDTAIKQHENLVNTLQKQGIEVISLPPEKNFTEQVFTRDIGFTLGEMVFVAEMAQGARKGEENVLIDWLKREGVPYYNLTGNVIEGGDVMIHGKKIFVGLSSRTNQQAIDNLQSRLQEYKVYTVPIDEKYLHLDCVFNIISETEALYFPKAFTEKEIQLLAEHFTLIEVNEREQFTMGTNVLSLGDKKVLSLPVNKELNDQLRKRDFDVIEVDISEIIKSGGSFRCCTLPILRES
ncbi:hypothetical protein CR194_13575 [Salipaludibacillus keqinensis]|uniref:N-dimethylarginine dimethylaminohydrolase n=1 Tax=Salipaludibacillus keqinensis TaxID=2045207 RepID=A0A323TCD1_9BACI|nr:hypothetical protein CR194_13575 [Salipaludibacillus keqinensis]